MPDYRIPKGVFDILPSDPDPQGAWRETFYWQYIEAEVRRIAAEYGFQEIRTPIFEHTDLFQRGIGATSDIVSKEMYTFLDKGERSITLRPEGTAPVIRAFIEKKLEQQKPFHKFYYICPVFRYERQQAGRYRQHHQFGVEAIGYESPLQDVEVIDLLYSFLKRLGLTGLTLNLNSIGDIETRLRYRQTLQERLKPHFDSLSAESQTRFHANPLRILDSKDPQDKKLLEELPPILDFLDEASRLHFQKVCEGLTEIGIPYVLNHKLVRGLDYYNRTVFEITAQELGAQNSLGGGGRYDSLMSELNGPSLPAFGFGSGLERIIQTMLLQKVSFPARAQTTLLFIPLGDLAQRECFKIMTQLRHKNISVEMDLSGKKLKNTLRKGVEARYVAIVGDNELATGLIQLKEFATGETKTIHLTALPEIFNA